MNRRKTMSYFNKIIFGIAGLVTIFFGFLETNNTVSALSVTPMKQSISLMPGDTYTGRVTTYQGGRGEGRFHFRANIVPLTVDDSDGSYVGVFDRESDYTDIVNWTTLSNGAQTVGYGDEIEGYAALGENVDLIYTINVPEDARGGGHYFAVIVGIVPDGNANGGVVITDSISIASVVYAEVAGDISIKGSIKDNNISNFLLNPPVTASFVVKNEGNTHSEAIYYMQAFSLFSGEEIYTTEESPSTQHVLPGTTRYLTQQWDEAPTVGIFRVRQTVYYDSTDNEPSVTEKIVIICPIWLVFIILFVIFALIFYFVTKAKARKKVVKKKAEGSA